MPELSLVEQEDLARCECVIERGLGSFLLVGAALLEIRESRLYRAYGTFEAYCQVRWNIGRSRIYQLMDSARVISDLDGGGRTADDPDVHRGGHEMSTPSPTPVLPTSERQVRPLARLAPEERAEVWREAVATAPEGRVTAKHVESVVERRSRPSGFPAVPGTPPYPEGVPILDVPGLPDEPGLDDPDEGEDGSEVDRASSPPDSPPSQWGEDSPAPAPVEVSDVLDTWIETLPLRRSLDDRARSLYESDACLFRDFREILEDERVFDRTKALLKKYDRRGAYHAAIRNFFSTRKPQSWVICPPAEAGGCGGSGIADSGRTCPACRGRGYRLHGVATQKQIALLKRLGIPDGACLDPGTASGVIDDRLNGMGK